jgi:hypothetical protein
MKALTISQPFANHIANGTKWIENRVWPTSYRGVIAIHAGAGTQYLTKEQLADYPVGKVIAVAEIVGCESMTTIEACGRGLSANQLIPGTQITWEQAYQHAHCEGPFCWILANVRKVKPVKVTGRQRLWNLPEGLELKYE